MSKNTTPALLPPIYSMIKPKNIVRNNVQENKPIRNADHFVFLFQHAMIIPNPIGTPIKDSHGYTSNAL